MGLGVPAGLLPAEDAAWPSSFRGIRIRALPACDWCHYRFRRELWPAMVGKFGPELKQFRKQYRVSRRTMPGKLRLINQFNVLQKQA
jgi:hypothetical protein